MKSQIRRAERNVNAYYENQSSVTVIPHKKHGANVETVEYEDVQGTKVAATKEYEELDVQV